MKTDITQERRSPGVCGGISPEWAFIALDFWGGDEIYVDAAFIDGDGHQITTKSNVVSGSWGWCAQ